MKPWRIKSKEDVSPSPWFPIERHTVITGKGQEVDDYYITTMGDVVMILPITSEGKIVFVRQYKHGQFDFLLELPGGFIKEGDTPLDSAIAELVEETGILVTESQLTSLGKVCHVPTKSTQVVHGYIATGLEFNANQKFDELEEIEVVLLEPRDAIERVINNNIWVSDTMCFLLKAKHLYPDLFS